MEPRRRSVVRPSRIGALIPVLAAVSLSGCALLRADGDRPSHIPWAQRQSGPPSLQGVDRLDLDGVTILGGPVRPIDPAGIDDLEARLGIEVPAGYRDYMVQLGDGMLCTTLRVHPPETVLANLAQHRGMMAAYWFWSPGEVPFGQDEAMASVQIADDMIGDVVMISPGDAEHLFVLPRDGDQVLVRDADLLSLAAAMCRGELGGGPGPEVVFEPASDGPLADRGWPAPIAPDLPPPDLTQPPRELLETYLGELADAEARAIEQAGGPDVVQRDEVPEPLRSRLGDQLEARLAGIHLRYLSPELALVSRGVIPWSVPPEHSQFRIGKEEAPSEDEVRFLVHEPSGLSAWWTFRRGADGWRLVKLSPVLDLPG